MIFMLISHRLPVVVRVALSTEDDQVSGNLLATSLVGAVMNIQHAIATVAELAPIVCAPQCLASLLLPVISL
jgi:hypothetical protein